MKLPPKTAIEQAIEQDFIKSVMKDYKKKENIEGALQLLLDDDRRNCVRAEAYKLYLILSVVLNISLIILLFILK